MNHLTSARGRIAFWALAGLALFVGHDAIYLAQVGPGEPLAAALRTAGHGYWGWASLGLALIGAVAVAAMALRLHRLRQRAGRLGATASPPRGFLRRAGVTWGRLFATVAVAFVLQESAEHFIAHGHLSGLGALLGPESPLAIPVLGTVTFIAGVIATMAAGTEAALVAAIRRALARQPRAPRTLAPRAPARVAVATASVLSRLGAGRAPPLTSLT